MKKRFLIVSIDTEGDSRAGWCLRYPFEIRGVTEGIRERLTPLFQKYGIPPTYLLSHEILKNPEAVEILKQISDCELGTHLHWDAPNQYPYHDRMHRYMMQGLFSYEEEYAQMECLTKLFTDKIGYTPKSFRAGRFGIGKNTCHILNRLGYTVDSSITPHLRHFYNDNIYFPDFTNASERPHFTPFDGNLNETGTSPLLEVPVSVRMRKRYWDPCGVLAPRVVIWLRPFCAPAWMIADMIRKESNSDVIVLMFHNVELVADCSPYTQTAEDVLRYQHDLEFILKKALKYGYIPVTLSEYYKIHKGNYL